MSDISSNKSTAAIPVARDRGTLRRMNSNAPAQKVTAAVIAAAIVQILVWLYGLGEGPAIPTDVTGALTVIITLIAGYLAPPGSSEEIVEIQRS
ncbi:hypothetical protein [Roseobacter sp. OBYS 0001]|uniref:hypothetical protein n=1 Tax=Roseobacter sp. OBYS 0001 TaxID=882651 RepID=UPI001BC2D0F5|nr:hypothetical protein [Roseobacter sp. OBYS 0001]GIT88881.1 hypothetical protein ROBYS_38970 [Roseobacter sp. OBYS 0001]